jgi:exopolysaccharide biosynthesis polyprenyl glycosylphosphotransferase
MENMNQRKNFEQYKRMLRFFAAMLLVAAQTAVFAFCWYRYFNPEIRKPYENKGNLLMIAVYLALLLVFLAAFGGLKIGYMKKGNIILSQVLSIIAMHVIVLVQILLISGKLYRLPRLAGVTFVMTLVDIFIAVVFIHIFHVLYYRLFPPRKMLLIYQDRPPEPLMQKMYARRDKYNICEHVNIASGMDRVKKLILKYDGVILCDIHAKKRNNLLKYCYKYGIRVYTTPKISDIILKNSEILPLFDTPLFLSRNQGLSFEQKLVKRMMDIVISAVLLVVTSPFMLITAIAVKAYDRGPVIFKQERVTVDGRRFYVYKFRSMIVNAEKDGVAVLATQHDSRITPVGRVIRATRLDELPQLYNILKGDMSLVGPRPERPEIMEKYEDTIPEFSYRLKVKAGLTGYAQVYGKYNTTAYDKLKMDLMYIENYSLLMDIRLLFMTVKVIFMKESTEGLSKEQLEELISKEHVKK